MLPLHPPQRTRVLSAPWRDLEAERRGMPGFKPQLHYSLGVDVGQVTKPLWASVSKCIDAGTLAMFPESVRRRFPTQSTN